MAELVRTFTAEDLEDVYLEVMTDGVVSIKDAITKKYTGKIVPSESHKVQFSKAGRAKHQNETNKQVDELLVALKIDPTDPKARFLCTSAVTGKSGDNLRSFLALVDLFQPDNVIPTPVIQVLMSDKAYAEFAGLETDQSHEPANWMQDESLPPDNNWEDLKPHDSLEPGNGEVIQVVKIGGNAKGKGKEDE